MACPSEEQLAGLLLDSQSPELAAVREHVGACAECRAWVEEVRREDEDLPHVRRVLVQEEQAHRVSVQEDQATSAGTSVQIGPGDATTFSPAAVFAASPDFQEYEIIEELGRGGMGAVYLATQKSTKRKVALKVLLEGPFASAAAKRRFEREVELAAQLQHPHIVTILESGIASGRYYFAMQYVEGERLDVYFAPRATVSAALAAQRPGKVSDPARQAGLTGGPAAQPATDMSAKLRLFAKICDAVNYAHQRGVIHRDLKPSNILIDAAGEPHILDFGLAKVADPEAERELMALSVTGQLMGTLPYMSPEQAMGLHHDIDIRSDVYALGVILYELLTRRFPYTVAGKIPDVLKSIIETPPKAPSSVEANINNEVETIVLKALSKERERRYQTAGDLGRDLGRYLAGEPIEAKRDSTMYVLGKMLRRYRSAVAVAAFFLVVALAGLFILTAQYAREREARATAQAQNLMTASLADATGVLTRLSGQEREDVRQRFAELATRYLGSAAWPERVMGSRAGLIVQPEAFWASIENGPLWQHGEWLELASMWPGKSGKAQPPAEVIAALMDKARTGTDRQKYVALCLLGQFGREEADKVFEQAARSESHPGVAAAGLWAARRIGRKIEPPLSQCLYRDELTGLTFVEVPPGEDFRRGSGPEDPDRIEDEDRPDEGVDVAAFRISTTEVTLAAFAGFYRETAKDRKVFGAFARGDAGSFQYSLSRQYETAADEQSRRAVCAVNLIAAKAYCTWLSRRGRDLAPPRRYRLPSEDEWEWACRGGNRGGRFCYGDDAKYADLFAKCNGTSERLFMVADRMPNFFGLFDMHGNLWEWCNDAVYRVDRETGRPLVQVDPVAGEYLLYTLRGGAFYSPAVRCRAAQRNGATEDGEGEANGFRIVMELAE